MCSNPDVLLVGASGRTSARKVIVLRGYLELSGQPIHKIVTNDHSQWIPDEFGGEYRLNIA